MYLQIVLYTQSNAVFQAQILSQQVVFYFITENFFHN